MGYLFSLFIYSGLIKAVFTKSDSSIYDITLIGSLGLYFLVIYNFVTNKLKIRNVSKDSNNILTISFFCIYTIFTIISAFYTSSPRYWLEKLIRITLITFPSFIVPFLFFGKKEIKEFMRASLIIFVIMMVTLSVIFYQYGLRYFAISNDLGEASYLMWGSYIGQNSLFFTGFILANIFTHTAKNKFFAYLFIILIGGLATFVLLVSGGRGPTLFFVIFYLLLLFSYQKNRKILLMLLPIIVIIIMVIGFDTAGGFPIIGNANRIYAVSIESSSIKARIGLIENAFQMIGDRPITGFGIGSFSYISTSIDGRGYPHNIFLEIWCENGIFALLSFLIFLLSVYYNSYKGRRGYYTVAFLIASLFLLSNFMKSFTLTDARTLFAFLGLLYSSSKIEKTSHSMFVLPKRF